MMYVKKSLTCSSLFFGLLFFSFPSTSVADIKSTSAEVVRFLFKNPFGKRLVHCACGASLVKLATDIGRKIVKEKASIRNMSKFDVLTLGGKILFSCGIAKCWSLYCYYDKVFSAFENDDADTLKALLPNPLAIWDGVWDRVWDRIPPLVLGSRDGRAKIVAWLLGQPGIEVNCKDKNGCTPLIRASLRGHTDIVRLLLANPGIEVNCKDKHCCTPLMWASYEGYTAIVRLLLDQPGIEVNCKDKHGCTPLMWASWEGHTDIVRLLRDQPGIEVNCKNDYGDTPLI